MARRFGSAMISKTDSTLFIYSTEHMRVKAYKGRSKGLAIKRPLKIPTGTLRGLEIQMATRSTFGSHPRVYRKSHLKGSDLRALVERTNHSASCLLCWFSYWPGAPLNPPNNVQFSSPWLEKQTEGTQFGS